MTTSIVVFLYFTTYSFSIGQVKDNSMLPFLRKAGFPFSDTVFYFKFSDPKGPLRNTMVALMDTFTPGNVVFRRVIADEGQWIQRVDDGGIIKIPKGHLWIECENPSERSLDSLGEDFGGPISRTLVHGECKSIVWPIWRRT